MKSTVKHKSSIHPTERQGDAVIQFRRELHGNLARKPGPDQGAVILKILFVAFNFPPDAEVGAKRVAGLCRYLPELGVEPVILTSQPGVYEAKDYSFPSLPGVQVVRAPMLFMNPLDWYRLGKLRLFRSERKSGNSDHAPGATKEHQQHMASPRDPGPLRKFVRYHLVPIFGLPDEYWPWYLPALREARRILRRERIDAVVSTGPPWTSHLVGRRLYQEFQIPWLVDFRDMWMLDDWRFKFPEWRNRIERRWEGDCVQYSTRIICTTKASRDCMAQAYPAFAEKISVLTNGFDKESSGGNHEMQANAIENSENPKSTRPTFLLHLGKLYIGRRIDTFCQAIQKLMAAQSLSAGQLKVLFLGASDPEFVTQANQVAPELIRNKVIEFADRIPWQDALKLMAQADLLLIIQGMHRLAIPAKLYEYLQTGKPIFAVVVPGALSEMLADLGAGVSADPDNAAAMANAIWTALHLPTRTPEQQERITRQFNYRNLAQTLAGWITEAASRG